MTSELRSRFRGSGICAMRFSILISIVRAGARRALDPAFGRFTYSLLLEPEGAGASLFSIFVLA